jgi:hypothetical protein
MATDPKRRGKGCAFYGCLAGIVCMLAILVAFLLGIHMFKKMLTEFTDTQPMALPTVELPPAELRQLQQRVEDFSDAVRAEKPTPPLELTGNEIDALLSSNPDFRAARGKVYVTIDGGKLKSQLSVPMEQVGLPRFKGRYLNGTATLDLSLQNGVLRIAPEQFLAKDGKPLPSIYLNVIRKQNLGARLNENPRLSIAMDRLKSIEVKDGKLVLTAKDQTNP